MLAGRRPQSARGPRHTRGRSAPRDLIDRVELPADPEVSQGAWAAAAVPFEIAADPQNSSSSSSNSSSGGLHRRDVRPASAKRPSNRDINSTDIEQEPVSASFSSASRPAVGSLSAPRNINSNNNNGSNSHIANAMRVGAFYQHPVWSLPALGPLPPLGAGRNIPFSPAAAVLPTHPVDLGQSSLRPPDRGAGLAAISSYPTGATAASVLGSKRRTDAQPPPRRRIAFGSTTPARTGEPVPYATTPLLQQQQQQQQQQRDQSGGNYGGQLVLAQGASPSSYPSPYSYPYQPVFAPSSPPSFSSYPASRPSALVRGTAGGLLHPPSAHPLAFQGPQVLGGPDANRPGGFYYLFHDQRTGVPMVMPATATAPDSAFVYMRQQQQQQQQQQQLQLQLQLQEEEDAQQREAQRQTERQAVLSYLTSPRCLLFKGCPKTIEVSDEDLDLLLRVSESLGGMGEALNEALSQQPDPVDDDVDRLHHDSSGDVGARSPGSGRRHLGRGGRGHDRAGLNASTPGGTASSSASSTSTLSCSLTPEQSKSAAVGVLRLLNNQGRRFDSFEKTVLAVKAITIGDRALLDLASIAPPSSSSSSSSSSRRVSTTGSVEGLLHGVGPGSGGRSARSRPSSSHGRAASRAHGLSTQGSMNSVGARSGAQDSNSNSTSNSKNSGSGSSDQEHQGLGGGSNVAASASSADNSGVGGSNNNSNSSGAGAFESRTSGDSRDSRDGSSGVQAFGASAGAGGAGGLVAADGGMENLLTLSRAPSQSLNQSHQLQISIVRLHFSCTGLPSLHAVARGARAEGGGSSATSPGPHAPPSTPRRGDRNGSRGEGNGDSADDVEEDPGPSATVVVWAKNPRTAEYSHLVQTDIVRHSRNPTFRVPVQVPSGVPSVRVCVYDLAQLDRITDDDFMCSVRLALDKGPLHNLISSAVQAHAYLPNHQQLAGGRGSGSASASASRSSSPTPGSSRDGQGFGSPTGSGTGTLSARGTRSLADFPSLTVPLTLSANYSALVDSGKIPMPPTAYLVVSVSVSSHVPLALTSPTRQPRLPTPLAAAADQVTEETAAAAAAEQSTKPVDETDTLQESRERQKKDQEKPRQEDGFDTPSTEPATGGSLSSVDTPDRQMRGPGSSALRFFPLEPMAEAGPGNAAAGQGAAGRSNGADDDDGGERNKRSTSDNASLEQADGGSGDRVRSGLDASLPGPQTIRLEEVNDDVASVGVDADAGSRNLPQSASSASTSTSTALAVVGPTGADLEAVIKEHVGPLMEQVRAGQERIREMIEQDRALRAKQLQKERRRAAILRRKQNMGGLIGHHAHVSTNPSLAPSGANTPLVRHSSFSFAQVVGRLHSVVDTHAHAHGHHHGPDTPHHSYHGPDAHHNHHGHHSELAEAERQRLEAEMKALRATVRSQNAELVRAARASAAAKREEDRRTRGQLTMVLVHVQCEDLDVGGLLAEPVDAWAEAWSLDYPAGEYVVTNDVTQQHQQAGTSPMIEYRRGGSVGPGELLDPLSPLFTSRSNNGSDANGPSSAGTYGAMVGQASSSSALASSSRDDVSKAGSSPGSVTEELVNGMRVVKPPFSIIVDDTYASANTGTSTSMMSTLMSTAYPPTHALAMGHVHMPASSSSSSHLEGLAIRHARSPTTSMSPLVAVNEEAANETNTPPNATLETSTSTAIAMTAAATVLETDASASTATATATATASATATSSESTGGPEATADAETAKATSSPSSPSSSSSEVAMGNAELHNHFSAEASTPTSSSSSSSAEHSLSERGAATVGSGTLTVLPSALMNSSINNSNAGNSSGISGVENGASALSPATSSMVVSHLLSQHQQHQHHHQHPHHHQQQQQQPHAGQHFHSSRQALQPPLQPTSAAVSVALPVAVTEVCVGSSSPYFLTPLALPFYSARANRFLIRVCDACTSTPPSILLSSTFPGPAVSVTNATGGFTSAIGASAASSSSPGFGLESPSFSTVSAANYPPRKPLSHVVAVPTSSGGHATSSSSSSSSASGGPLDNILGPSVIVNAPAAATQGTGIAMEPVTATSIATAAATSSESLPGADATTVVSPRSGSEDGSRGSFSFGPGPAQWGARPSMSPAAAAVTVIGQMEVSLRQLVAAQGPVVYSLFSPSGRRLRATITLDTSSFDEKGMYVPKKPVVPVAPTGTATMTPETGADAQQALVLSRGVSSVPRLLKREWFAVTVDIAALADYLSPRVKAVTARLVYVLGDQKDNPFDVLAGKAAPSSITKNKTSLSVSGPIYSSSLSHQQHHQQQQQGMGGPPVRLVVLAQTEVLAVSRPAHPLRKAAADRRRMLLSLADLASSPFVRGPIGLDGKPLVSDAPSATASSSSASATSTARPSSTASTYGNSADSGGGGDAMSEGARALRDLLTSERQRQGTLSYTPSPLPPRTRRAPSWWRPLTFVVPVELWAFANRANDYRIELHGVEVLPKSATLASSSAPSSDRAASTTRTTLIGVVPINAVEAMGIYGESSEELQTRKDAHDVLNKPGVSLPASGTFPASAKAAQALVVPMLAWAQPTVPTSSSQSSISLSSTRDNALAPDATADLSSSAVTALRTRLALTPASVTEAATQIQGCFLRLCPVDVSREIRAAALVQAAYRGRLCRARVLSDLSNAVDHVRLVVNVTLHGLPSSPLASLSARTTSAGPRSPGTIRFASPWLPSRPSSPNPGPFPPLIHSTSASAAASSTSTTTHGLASPFSVNAFLLSRASTTAGGLSRATSPSGRPHSSQSGRAGVPLPPRIATTSTESSSSSSSSSTSTTWQPMIAVAVMERDPVNASWEQLSATEAVHDTFTASQQSTTNLLLPAGASSSTSSTASSASQSITFRTPITLSYHPSAPQESFLLRVVRSCVPATHAPYSEHHHHHHHQQQQQQQSSQRPGLAVSLSGSSSGSSLTAQLSAGLQGGVAATGSTSTAATPRSMTPRPPRMLPSGGVPRPLLSPSLRQTGHSSSSSSSSSSSASSATNVFFPLDSDQSGDSGLANVSAASATSPLVGVSPRVAALTSTSTLTPSGIIQDHVERAQFVISALVSSAFGYVVPLLDEDRRPIPGATAVLTVVSSEPVYRNSDQTLPRIGITSSLFLRTDKQHQHQQQGPARPSPLHVASGDADIQTEPEALAAMEPSSSSSSSAGTLHKGHKHSESILPALPGPGVLQSLHGQTSPRDSDNDAGMSITSNSTDLNSLVATATTPTIATLVRPLRTADPETGTTDRHGRISSASSSSSIAAGGDAAAVVGAPLVTRRASAPDITSSTRRGSGSGSGASNSHVLSIAISLHNLALKDPSLMIVVWGKGPATVTSSSSSSSSSSSTSSPAGSSQPGSSPSSPNFTSVMGGSEDTRMALSAPHNTQSQSTNSSTKYVFVGQTEWIATSSSPVFRAPIVLSMKQARMSLKACIYNTSDPSNVSDACMVASCKFNVDGLIQQKPGPLMFQLRNRTGGPLVSDGPLDAHGNPTAPPAVMFVRRSLAPSHDDLYGPADPDPRVAEAVRQRMNADVLKRAEAGEDSDEEGAEPDDYVAENVDLDGDGTGVGREISPWPVHPQAKQVGLFLSCRGLPSKRKDPSKMCPLVVVWQKNDKGVYENVGQSEMLVGRNPDFDKLISVPRVPRLENEYKFAIYDAGLTRALEREALEQKQLASRSRRERGKQKHEQGQEQDEDQGQGQEQEQEGDENKEASDADGSLPSTLVIPLTDFIAYAKVRVESLVRHARTARTGGASILHESTVRTASHFRQRRKNAAKITKVARGSNSLSDLPFVDEPRPMWVALEYPSKSPSVTVPLLDPEGHVINSTSCTLAVEIAPRRVTNDAERMRQRAAILDEVHKQLALASPTDPTANGGNNDIDDFGGLPSAVGTASPTIPTPPGTSSPANYPRHLSSSGVGDRNDEKDKEGEADLDPDKGRGRSPAGVNLGRRGSKTEVILDSSASAGPGGRSRNPSQEGRPDETKALLREKIQAQAEAQLMVAGVVRDDEGIIHYVAPDFIGAYFSGPTPSKQNDQSQNHSPSTSVRRSEVSRNQRSVPPPPRPPPPVGSSSNTIEESTPPSSNGRRIGAARQASRAGERRSDSNVSTSQQSQPSVNQSLFPMADAFAGLPTPFDPDADVEDETDDERNDSTANDRLASLREVASRSPSHQLRESSSHESMSRLGNLGSPRSVASPQTQLSDGATGLQSDTAVRNAGTEAEPQQPDEQTEHEVISLAFRSANLPRVHPESTVGGPLIAVYRWLPEANVYTCVGQTEMVAGAYANAANDVDGSINASTPITYGEQVSIGCAPGEDVIIRIAVYEDAGSAESEIQPEDVVGACTLSLQSLAAEGWKPFVAALETLSGEKIENSYGPAVVEITPFRSSA